jgi:hypothetical protein
LTDSSLKHKKREPQGSFFLCAKTARAGALRDKPGKMGEKGGKLNKKGTGFSMCGQGVRLAIYPAELYN